MQLAFSPEQDLFRDSVRRFLEQHSAEPAVRATMERPEGHDPALWTAMAAQLGLQGLVIPERFGGSGFGQQELLVVLEETGRALACTPLLPTAALAVQALLASGDEAAQTAHLPGIAAGSVVATVALTDRGESWDPAGLSLRAAPAGAGWTLRGGQDLVLYGQIADLILVFAHTPDGLSLFAVEGTAPGLTRTTLRGMDLTRRLARLELDAVPATLVGAAGAGAEIFDEVLALGAIALAAEGSGGAQRVLEMSVEYAKTRTQFGRPVGSFQAIKHKCADMLLEVEAARSTAQYAALAADEGSADLQTAAWLAKLRCSQAFLRVSEDNILVHGGIAFTWEHPAHLYYRRARSDAILLGDIARCRHRLADLTGLRPAV